MSGKTDPKSPRKPDKDRDARLKAALKANLKRRKQQARVRAGADDSASQEKE
ncbi:hypothetical protein [Salibaculum sp.]|uniref:hypothetical protein n=1 Tax=Salibaculum sp. TaxID=2855480 RepID=UPI002B49E881|nr:hypothetical protein [Salibaculum sp.]HKL70990.1 hypothetical protein [Salibaculum sp.]